jgi:hypothetical protein
MKKKGYNAVVYLLLSESVYRALYEEKRLHALKTWNIDSGAYIEHYYWCVYIAYYECYIYIYIYPYR